MGRGAVQEQNLGAGEDGADALRDQPVWLRVIAGPRDDWFTAGALAELTGSTYTVTPSSNRTGLRLTGTPLERARTEELPSEGMVTGGIQVPPDGQPILLLADHPVTGGYPVIAVVMTADQGRAAQLRPGQRVRFELG
jgi:allophanate hydrolase subunit 2